MRIKTRKKSNKGRDCGTKITKSELISSEKGELSNARQYEYSKKAKGNQYLENKKFLKNKEPARKPKSASTSQNINNEG
jgi:hypothetical protein